MLRWQMSRSWPRKRWFTTPLGHPLLRSRVPEYVFPIWLFLGKHVPLSTLSSLSIRWGIGQTWLSFVSFLSMIKRKDTYSKRTVAGKKSSMSQTFDPYPVLRLAVSFNQSDIFNQQPTHIGQVNIILVYFNNILFFFLIYLNYQMVFTVSTWVR